MIDVPVPFGDDMASMTTRNGFQVLSNAWLLHAWILRTYGLNHEVFTPAVDPWQEDGSRGPRARSVAV